ncbi:34690_t:CDS:2 [Gigaspora margarita]|uniref:34690_t:CDS:1 n=1 Tax=Gigaspora margarita TaxID=4874 RepID=A0ABN7UGC8_GIGMA|nr:34690_t:CDS:2 [Gigaspora margarita]
MSPCDFRLLAMARTPLGIRMGAPGTIVWDPLESAGGRIKQGQFTKWFFLHSVKYSITCASASSAGVGFIGELIFSKVSDIIFDEIQKLDPDLRNMPKLNIERMLNGVLSAQGFNELVTEIKKISLEEGIVEVVLRKSTRTASETFKEIGRRKSTSLIHRSRQAIESFCLAL